MRKLFLTIVLLFGCSKAQLPLAPELNTIVQVVAIQANGARLDSVQVFWDGNLVGMTPFRYEKASAGLHALRLMKDGFRVFTEQLEIHRGQSYSVEGVLHPLPLDRGELIVTVNQDSAVVLVKDSAENVVVQTQEKASAHLLRAGPYVVFGNKQGHAPVVKAVDITSGKAAVVNLEFHVDKEPPTLAFDIEQDTVKLGEALTLNWQSSGYQVIIDQRVGVRGPNGSEKLVCPATGLKVFTATAYGDGDLIRAEKDSVFIAPQTVTLEFSASPDSVTYGEPVYLEWRSDGRQVIIDQGVGTRGPVGSEEIYFPNPGAKLFTATAYGAGNTLVIRQDSVYIKEALDPILPVVELSTTKLVTVNTPANISWYTQSADYVVVDFVGSAGLQGMAEVVFSTSGIRVVTATAYNQSGYVSATDTIEVVEPQVEYVDDIMVAANRVVRADKGEAGLAAISAASVEIEAAGRYEIRANVWYNSGDSQLNESYYLELRGPAGNLVLPIDSNAGSHKVVPDDAGEPHTAARASGRFDLNAGTYSIDIYHYAKIAGRYPQFLNGPVSGSESVKVLGFTLVYSEN